MLVIKAVLDFIFADLQKFKELTLIYKYCSFRSLQKDISSIMLVSSINILKNDSMTCYNNLNIFCKNSSPFWV
jgi:hypothetical protein